MNKRGLSPVIATVLLIAIALVLAAIIFFWAKAFLGEQPQKFGEPIENACGNVDFEVESIAEGALLGSIEIVNRGNVPIHSLEIRERGSSSEKISTSVIQPIGTGVGSQAGTLKIGDTGSVVFDPDIPTDDYSVDAEIVVVPIIRGVVDENQENHVCDVKYGKVSEVVSV